MAILEVKGITKRFGGLVAVNELDVTIEEGEILGMIGPNGAGKTTAFNMISGFYEEDEGKVIFRGEDITHLRPDQICKKGLARTFQVVKPFPRYHASSKTSWSELITIQPMSVLESKGRKTILISGA